MSHPVEHQEFPPAIKKKKVDNWIITGFREDEIQFNKNHIIDEIEKYHKDLYLDLVANKNTMPRPTYQAMASNILTLIGLTESAKRDTGETSTSLTHTSLGSSATTPAEGDTDLGTEFTGGTPTYARKEYATDGQRKVINQTAKYGMLWDDGDIDVTPPISVREAGIHNAVSGSSNIHAHVTFTTFTFDTGDLFVLQINELQANA